jgi:NAD(P)-dependent dehydrogenase (short-subunit alcohol dehydrogenase family)
MSARAAIVTGASRGIGYACAERLAGDGYALLVCSRDAADIEQAAERLRAGGADVVALAADVGVPADCRRIVAACVEAYGHVDALVNNAAIYVARPFLDIDAEHWDETMAIDLRGPALLSVAVARGMRDRGEGGRIVHISSDNALKAELEYAAYNAAKAALVSLTLSMAGELGQYGIITNAVLPGWTRTRMTEAYLEEVSAEDVGRVIPLGRAAEPSETAQVVSFLCNPEVTYVLGQSISVDGGLLSTQPSP